MLERLEYSTVSDDYLDLSLKKYTIKWDSAKKIYLENKNTLNCQQKTLIFDEGHFELRTSIPVRINLPRYKYYNKLL